MTLRVLVDATSWVNRRGFRRFARNAVGRPLVVDAETTYLLRLTQAARGETLDEFLVPSSSSSARPDTSRFSSNPAGSVSFCEPRSLYAGATTLLLPSIGFETFGIDRRR